MNNFEIVILKEDKICKKCDGRLKAGKKVLRVKNRRLGDNEGYIYYHNKKDGEEKQMCDCALAIKILKR